MNLDSFDGWLVFLIEFYCCVAFLMSSDIMMRRDEFCAPKIPTLVDLCVQKVIDNVRYLGNVGYVDQHLLERILPHCTVDQLMHVEKSTKVTWSLLVDCQ